MRKSFKRLLLFSLIAGLTFYTQNLKALVPLYYFPETKKIKQDALFIGKLAYELLYFGQIKEYLSLIFF